jgi:hypothetical protein
LNRISQFQQEATKLLSSWSRAQNQQQENDQQLQEVRASLKRKVEDFVIMKKKLAKEVIFITFKHGLKCFSV